MKTQGSESRKTESLFDEPLSELPAHFKQWKDELNLAEFPIAALSNRVDPEQKTLEFSDEIHDNSTGGLITRNLVITASDKYGLPTAIDDEIILGLIQISRLGEFASPEVNFSRYQLIETLGWKQTTRNYQRIEIALKRWMGVTLYYQNAWRDRDTNEWVDANFHILDNVEIVKKGTKSSLGQNGRCYIKWNQHVFRNFTAGNFKKLDFQIFRQLKSNVSKRLYRFLDKRFGQRPTWSFRMEKLAFEKLGLSRSYSDMGQVKRKLAEAIAELEEVKFIKPLKTGERFERVSKGLWRVHFHKYSETEERQEKLPVEVAPESPIEAKLTALGVVPTEAKRLVTEFPEDFLLDKIEVVEYKKAQKGGKPLTNIPGYLVNSIRDNYSNPSGFQSTAKKRALQKRASEIREQKALKEKELADKREEELAEAKKAAEETTRKIQEYLDRLDENERESFIEEAYAQARERGATSLKKSGMIGDLEREVALIQQIERNEAE